MNDPHVTEPAHGHTEPTPHHAVPYHWIFLSLIALTIVTVVAAWVHIESELVKILVALSIATVKASLVCIFFMHLKFEGKLIYTILFVPLVLCVLLVVALIPDVLNGQLFNDPPTTVGNVPVHGMAAPEHTEPAAH